MTTYRHPELGEWKTGDEPIEFVIKDNNGEEVIRRRFADDGLLYIGFEEVKEEPKQDWIDKALELVCIQEANQWKKALSEHGKKVIKDSIVKYMPQQKKFEKHYIAVYCEKTKNRVLEDTMIEFLRDHGLLEE